MLKILFGLALLALVVLYVIARKKEETPLSIEQRRLQEEAGRSQVLDVREKVVDVLGENTRKQKILEREERKNVHKQNRA